MIALDAVTAAVNPYLLYIKLAGLALLVAGLIGIGIWFKGVLSDRDKYQLEAKRNGEIAAAYKEQRDGYAQLAKDITESVKQIKVQSTTIVERIENSPTPSFTAGSNSIPFIPAGMPEGVQGNATTSNDAIASGISTKP